MIDCLYVYIYYISNVLLIYFLLFSSSNRHVCAAVRIAHLIVFIVCILLLFYMGNMQFGHSSFSLFDQRGSTTSYKLQVSLQTLCHIFFPISFIHTMFIHCIWDCFLQGQALLSPFSLSLDITSHVSLYFPSFPVYSLQCACVIDHTYVNPPTT